VQEKPVATGPIYLGIYFLSSTKMEQKCDRFSLGHTYLFITLGELPSKIYKSRDRSAIPAMSVNAYQRGCFFAVS
ncbi:MAG: hypothetical protein U9Q68_07200, partial [Euryarchaeota archaeon]|nr:hypothetical protein [Euryarchaeota archaeon]